MISDYSKVQIAQNEIEKKVNSISRELGLTEELTIWALDLTISKIRAMINVRDAYMDYEKAIEEQKKQDEFAEKLQTELQNSMTKEETE